MISVILGILTIKFICFYYILEPTYGQRVGKNIAYAAWMLVLSLVSYLIYSLTMGLMLMAIGKGNEPFVGLLDYASMINYFGLILLSIILISLYEYILFYHFRKLLDFKQRFVWNIITNAVLIGIIATNSHNFENFMAGSFFILFTTVMLIKRGRF
jgi:hypothetical protein